MRAMAFAAVWMLLSTSTEASAPSAYLRCIGHDARGSDAEHAVVLYLTKAQVDGDTYDFGADDAEYSLLGDTVSSKIFGGPPTLIVIDRVTGNYKVSRGTTQTESGHCDKVQRQL